MTCIVAYKTEDKIFIGGDRLGSAGNRVSLRKRPKVFIKDFQQVHEPMDGTDISMKKQMGIGYCGSFRMGDILEYQFKVPEMPKNIKDEMEYMVTKFVPALIKCYVDNTWLRKKDDIITGGWFIVVFNKRMFIVESDFQIAEEVGNYIAVGCGDDLAKGAFYVLDKEEKTYRAPKEIVKIALEASVHHSNFVGGVIDVLEVE